MPLSYPKQLTDPIWKKVEKAAGVSGTGVGETLRAAETAFKTLGTGMDAAQKGTKTAASVKPARAAAATALRKSEQQVQKTYPKVKDEKKKDLLWAYGRLVSDIAGEIENMNLDRHNDAAELAIKRFNDRAKMHVTNSKIPAS
jgi:hypothetical protein